MSKEHNPTKALLLKILLTPFEAVYEHKCQTGHAEKLIQRVRVELSRVRAKYSSKKNNIPKFSLKAEITRTATQPYDLIKFTKIRDVDDTIKVDTSGIDKVIDEIIAESKQPVKVSSGTMPVRLKIKQRV